MAKKVQKEEKKLKGKKQVETIKKEKDVKVTKVKDEVKEVVETKNFEKVNTKDKEVAKDNTKRKKIIKTVIYSLIVILLIGAFIYSIIESSGRKSYFNTVNYSQTAKIMNEDKLSIIYWASPNCGFCTQFTPIVKEVSIEKGVEFNYLNAAEISNEDYGAFLSQVGSFDETYNTNGLGTPSLVLVQNGKVVDVSEGAQSKADLVNYLTTRGFIN